MALYLILNSGWMDRHQEIHWYWAIQVCFDGCHFGPWMSMNGSLDAAVDQDSPRTGVTWDGNESKGSHFDHVSCCPRPLETLWKWSSISSKYHLPRKWRGLANEIVIDSLDDGQFMVNWWHLNNFVGYWKRFRRFPVPLTMVLDLCRAQWIFRRCVTRHPCCARVALGHDAVNWLSHLPTAGAAGGFEGKVWPEQHRHRMASSFTTTICNFGDVSGVWTMTNPKPPVQMVSWCHSCGLCRPADALEDERGNVCGADLVGSSHEFHGFHGFHGPRNWWPWRCLVIQVVSFFRGLSRL